MENLRNWSANGSLRHPNPRGFTMAQATKIPSLRGFVAFVTFCSRSG
jgi:hypothetical protein